MLSEYNYHTHREAVLCLLEGETHTNSLTLPEGLWLQDEDLVDVFDEGELEGFQGVLGDGPTGLSGVKDDCITKTL